jgi:hypothetical protein
VQERGLGVLQLLCHVTSKTEVRVLVDSAGDEAWNVGHRSEDLREGIGEGRCSLDCRKVDLAYVVSELCDESLLWLVSIELTSR